MQGSNLCLFHILHWQVDTLVPPGKLKEARGLLNFVPWVSHLPHSKPALRFSIVQIADVSLHPVSTESGSLRGDGSLGI